MNPEISGKIEELQMLEHNIQNMMAQKQAVQIELNEIETASKELESSDGEAFKISGGIMIKSSPEKLQEELKEKKKVSQLRLESIQKQEKNLEDKANSLKKEVQEAVKKEAEKSGSKN